jgi:hypothetical protein
MSNIKALPANAVFNFSRASTPPYNFARKLHCGHEAENR